MTNVQDLNKTGEELYKQFKEGNYIGEYVVDRNFIDKLSESETQILMKGFIEERKIHITDDTESDHIETFWAMYDECK